LWSPGKLVGQSHFYGEMYVLSQPVGIALLAKLGAYARYELVFVQRPGEIVVDAHFQRLVQLAAIACADQH